MAYGAKFVVHMVLEVELDVQSCLGCEGDLPEDSNAIPLSAGSGFLSWDSIQKESCAVICKSAVA